MLLKLGFARRHKSGVLRPGGEWHPCVIQHLDDNHTTMYAQSSIHSIYIHLYMVHTHTHNFTFLLFYNKSVQFKSLYTPFQHKERIEGAKNISQLLLFFFKKLLNYRKSLFFVKVTHTFGFNPLYANSHKKIFYF